MPQTPLRPVIRTQADLEQLWRRLMSPLGFGSCSVWLVVVDGERPTSHVVEFARTPSHPEDGSAEVLARALENLAGPNISFAFLRSRPGGGRPDADDLAWAHTLYDVGRRTGVPLHTVHLAHNHDVLPVAVDDLIAQPR
jgi:hypothetical protein